MRLLKTFIVEDSPVIRESLIATLEELAPVKVVGVADDEPSAALWLASAGASAGAGAGAGAGVDLLIIDIFLKAGSGLGVLATAGRMAGAHTSVVLSNYATPDMRRKCLELGAARVFDKSHEIDALIDYCVRLSSDRAADSVAGALG